MISHFQYTRNKLYSCHFYSINRNDSGAVVCANSNTFGDEFKSILMTIPGNKILKLKCDTYSSVVNGIAPRTLKYNVIDTRPWSIDVMAESNSKSHLNVTLMCCVRKKRQIRDYILL